MAERMVVMLDNDECIGSFADLSLLWGLRCHYGADLVPDALFLKLLDTLGCVRPHLRVLFDTLIVLRRLGLITKVVMCTAASNVNGWVTFLCQLLHTWYDDGQTLVYDHVITLETLDAWHRDRGTNSRMPNNTVVKDMDLVREVARVDAHTPVFAIDDRVRAIVNHTVGWEVPAYRVTVDMRSVMHEHCSAWWTPELAAHYADNLKPLRAVLPQDAFATDDALHIAAATVASIAAKVHALMTE